MLCKCQGVFRLTRDLELKYLSDGTPVAKLGLACSEKYKEKETQLFLEASIFGKASEILSQYAGTKGTQIFLTGKLKTEQWEKDGQKHSKIVMAIEDFQFISSNSKHGQEDNEKASRPQQQIKMPENTLPEIDIDEQSLPF
jgi:single-strand DNA-binding protein